MRKLSLFIATSVDGYIAQPNDDLSFLKSVEKKEKIMVMENLLRPLTPLLSVEKHTIMFLRK